MKNLKTALNNKLKGAKKIAILGIGSELRADDAAGILVAEALIKSCRDITKPKLKVFIGATAPENLTGEIKRFRPTHVLIVDSADMGKPAGTVDLLDLNKERQVTFCTHRLPNKILADYLAKDINCKVVVVGIQPKTLEFGQAPSSKVAKSVRQFLDTLKIILKEALK